MEAPPSKHIDVKKGLANSRNHDNIAYWLVAVSLFLHDWKNHQNRTRPTNGESPRVSKLLPNIQNSNAGKTSIFKHPAEVDLRECPVGHCVENRCTVTWCNCSPGFNNVVGKDSRFAALG